MKTKRIKAKMLWAHPDRMVMYKTNCDGNLSPYVILPADADSYERMVKQMDVVIEEAINRWLAGYGGQDDLPRAALRAIGINPPKKGRK